MLRTAERLCSPSNLPVNCSAVYLFHPRVHRWGPISQPPNPDGNIKEFRNLEIWKTHSRMGRETLLYPYPMAIWTPLVHAHASFQFNSTMHVECGSAPVMHLYTVTNPGVQANSAFHLPGSVNEYQLRLRRQRQVWFIPLADERGVCR